MSYNTNGVTPSKQLEMSLIGIFVVETDNETKGAANNNNNDKIE